MKRKRTITKVERGKSMKRERTIHVDRGNIWPTSDTSQKATVVYLAEYRWAVRFWNDNSRCWCITTSMLVWQAEVMADLLNYQRKNTPSGATMLMETLPLIQGQLVNAKKE